MIDLHRDRALIAGQWVNADDGSTFSVSDPATGRTIATVADLGAAETLRAVSAASDALPAWSTLLSTDRADLLMRWHQLVQEHRRELAALMTAECGKPLAESIGEVRYGAGFIRWNAEEARRVYGTIIPAEQHDRRLLVLRRPIGVVAAITPWNFPFSMITRKVAPALAAGCTVVLKPSEETPLTALALAALAMEAGLPPGVLNLITTSHAAAVGQVLSTDPRILKITFTGSTAVGKQLMAQAAGTVKNIALELGGNAPFIVFDDADLDAAVAGAMLSKYRNTGQTCVCTNRFLVQEGVQEAFAQKLAAAVAGLKVGDGTEEGVTQGPLIDGAGLAKVEELLDDALAKGARVVCGGKRHARGGTFFEPTVIAGATPAMRLAREEIFGPVAPIFSFKDEAEAVRMANDTEFGLAAYFYSRDIARAWRVAEALDYGMVGVNSGMISNEVAPFGGIKQSGLGREGSRHGIEEYLEMKYVAMAGL
jgi:succinate-semialdehyde dehydrogenase/glutarate-semialdehyde dehydrogenase